MARKARRLAGVEAFRFQEVVEAAVDFVGHLPEKVGAFGDRELAPGTVKRHARCLHRRVHLGAAAFRHAAD